MYAGRIVEQGTVDEVLDAPMHPYTRGLLDSVPSRNRRGAPLAQIPGMTPSLLQVPTGCAFRSRCGRATDTCFTDPPLYNLGGRHVRCFHPIHVEDEAEAPE
jgi:peptide/nickel transport system ATP-binding protein